MIGIKTALLLFTILFAASCFALKGQARYFCWIVIAGLAAKAVVHHYRSRLQ